MLTDAKPAAFAVAAHEIAAAVDRVVQAQKEIVTCSSCGRILYFTRDMDLTGGD